MTPSADRLTELACGVLRGEQPTWPFPVDDESVAACLLHAGYHGIGPLAVEALSDAAVWANWPAAVRESLERERQGLVALEMMRKRELHRIGQAFARSGINGILLKGAALAYGLYSSPLLRTRTDTDILVTPAVREQAGNVLIDLGYRKPLAIEGQYIKSQSQFLLETTTPHQTVDLHWRLTNTHLFTGALTFSELESGARILDAFGAALRIPGLVEALAHACIHRAINLPQGDGNRLIWLYDIHLLAGSLQGEQWAQFIDLAIKRNITQLCADALRKARACFGTRLPATEMERLNAFASGNEVSAELLTAGPMQARMLNYRSLPNWSARGKMLKEQLFPTAAFMRRRFAVKSRWGLAWAYTQRIFTHVK